MENCRLEENYRTEILYHLKSEKKNLPGRSNGVNKGEPAKARVAEAQERKCEEQGQKKHQEQAALRMAEWQLRPR